MRMDHCFQVATSSAKWQNCLTIGKGKSDGRCTIRANWKRRNPAAVLGFTHPHPLVCVFVFVLRSTHPHPIVGSRGDAKKA